jgi:hypothetical protein
VDIRWGIWVEWPGRADWTARAGAARLVQSVRLINATFPGLVDEFTVRMAKKRWSVDTPGVVDRLAGALVGRPKAADEDLFGDVNTLLFPVGPDRLSISCDQTGTDPVRARGRLDLDFYRPSGEYLTGDPAAVARLVAELCQVWEARNGWVDMVHVRQEWNRWTENYPVYGWATWLHPRYAMVDASGLDVDVTGTPDGGQLLVVRVDPAAMADPNGNTGRDVIRALIDRTVLADGRRLLDVAAEAGSAPASGE